MEWATALVASWVDTSSANTGGIGYRDNKSLLQRVPGGTAYRTWFRRGVSS